MTADSGTRRAPRHINVNEVLIYRLGSLGDTVMALPAIRQIRWSYPSSHITLLTNSPANSVAAPVVSVLGETGLYNDLIYYRAGTRSVNELRRISSEIRKRRIKLMFYLSAPRGFANSLRDFAFFKVSGISKVVGVPFARRDLSPAYDSRTGRWEWEAARLSRRVSCLGVIDLTREEFWDLDFSAGERRQAEALMSQYSIPDGAICFSLGAKEPVKDWGDDNWRELFTILWRAYPEFTLVAVGAELERERTEDVLREWRGAKANLCGRCLPRVSALVIKSSKVFIGHDSGPMHLAGAVGAPLVAIFSARNPPGQWYPRGDSNSIHYVETPCFGCGLQVCTEYGARCIRSVRVDDVVRSVRRHLG